MDVDVDVAGEDIGTLHERVGVGQHRRLGRLGQLHHVCCESPGCDPMHSVATELL